MFGPTALGILILKLFGLFEGKGDEETQEQTSNAGCLLAFVIPLLLVLLGIL